MKKDWFVLHTLTGQEGKAQKSMLARIRLEDMGEYVGQCVIPTQKVTETRNGKKRTMTKRVFPGYLLAELALYDESRPADASGKKAIFERTWQFLRETPGVIGFVGGERPMPLKPAEIDAILSNKPAEEQKPVVKCDFNVADEVKVKDGPFMGLTGQVSMVDPGKGKLKVEVSIFNRTVQVDAEYWQVEKVEEKNDSPADGAAR